MKVLYDFRCRDCGAVKEHYIERGTSEHVCPCGGVSDRVFLTLAKPHWAALAQGDSASPEAIARFDRVHRQQRDKELRSQERHGDYGPSPGAD